ncbi:MAG: hypothetical protein MK294_04700, partial [Rhodospirillales bacterium]|nr:hypothetical protein [Rhodospirillales bacterium]
TSALPPKADILRVVEKCLLMTQSGHSLDFTVKQVCIENVKMGCPRARPKTFTRRFAERWGKL